MSLKIDDVDDEEVGCGERRTWDRRMGKRSGSERGGRRWKAEEDLK
jgi:hypothetical protein